MKKISGFTLIELMIVVSVLAIVLAVGVPSLNQFMNNSRITVTTNDLVSALHVARSQAIREGAFGCVCPSSTASNAIPTCLGTNNWEEGWVSFLDRTGNCLFEPPDDVLLKVKDTSENDGTDFAVRTGAGDSVTSINYVRYNPKGIPEQLAGAGLRGVWSICDGRGKAQGNAVELSAAGSVRSTREVSLITACPFGL